ncbi:MAG TPA: hypothetical protein VF712_11210 [Thermoleophilaceae bacterium]|jgi:3',5'-cyclic AMP phosphodiesterase CpdA
MLGKRTLHAAVAALACLAAAAPAEARTLTTYEQTILDRDRDNRLEPAPGEPHLFRDNLGTTNPAIEPNPLGRIFFAQFTDNHIVDEESPLRVEYLDDFDRPFTSAYRPQEGLMAQVAEEMVDQVRNTVSPVTHERLDLAMQTGDNTDNTQCNETRWMIDIFDGGHTIDPNSGLEDGAPAPGVADQCDTQVAGQDPNPAFPPATPAGPLCDGPIPDDPRGDLYDGVRGDKQYYEPDASSPPPTDPSGGNPGSEDGRGYSPYEQENLAEEGRHSSVRDFPDLFERMNEPFRSLGLGLPWYSVFGNHDALIQGNQPRRPELEAIAVGCAKVRGPSPATRTLIEQAQAGGVDGDEAATILQEAIGDPDGETAIVPPDPRRRPLRKSEYIAEHFATTGAPVGHGYSPANVASGMGNYSFDPLPNEPDAPPARPGLRFVVLDTIAENGGDGGNVDDQQFQWLHQELLAAEARQELVMVFAHHSLRTMNQPPVSPFLIGDQGGNNSTAVHYGLGPGETETECEAEGGPPADPATPPLPTETLRCLMLRHPSVIAFVNGHEHENRIDPFPRHGEDRNQVEGGFWEINTASHIDWPQQSRVLDLVDNRDGSLSIFATMLDHSGPPNPGGAPPSDGRGEAADAVQRLAGIARELSFNDPDSRNGEDDEPAQRGDARGEPEDRNAELVVRNPYAP